MISDLFSIPGIIETRLLITDYCYLTVSSDCIRIRIVKKSNIIKVQPQQYTHTCSRNLLRNPSICARLLSVTNARVTNEFCKLSPRGLTLEMDYLKYKHTFLHFLCILYGFAGWMGANAVFLQVPTIIKTAPEGERMNSFVVLIVQSGNIGPLCYTILQRVRPVKDSRLIYGFLLLANISALSIAFLYNVTVTIGTFETSLWLFVCTFAFALVACTSSVLFMPYMGRFKEVYMITYLLGQGLAGFISSLIALGQGDAEHENFSVRTFFLITFFMYLVSSIAFFLINQECFRTEYADVTIEIGNRYTFKREPSYLISSRTFAYLIATATVLSFVCNAVLPSIQAFSTEPYGGSVNHYSVVFSLMANPLADLVGYFTPRRTVKVINMLICVVLVPMVYLFTIALMYDQPPLRDSNWGAYLTIGCWTIYTGMYSFINLSILAVFRAQGGRSLVQVGGAAQIGSFTGSIVMFLIVNFTGAFKK